jgi:hypothetical protein
VLAGDITVYETVTVKTGVELSSPAPVTIRAGSAFVIEPGAVVSPNINFEIATPNGCTDGYQPTPISALTAYCVSQAYNSADRQVQSLPDQDDPQPPFEEKKPIPFTAAPNPFTGEITLSFSLPEADRVSLTVLDLTGRTVATIWQDRTQEAGEVEVPWIGSELAPGIYIAVLETRRGRETVRIVKQ